MGSACAHARACSCVPEALLLMGQTNDPGKVFSEKQDTAGHITQLISTLPMILELDTLSIIHA